MSADWRGDKRTARRARLVRFLSLISQADCLQITATTPSSRHLIFKHLSSLPRLSLPPLRFIIIVNNNVVSDFKEI